MIISEFRSRDAQTHSKASIVDTLGFFLNRDNGIFDNLPFSWRRSGVVDSRRELYKLLSGSEGQSIVGDKLSLNAILRDTSVLDNASTFSNIVGIIFQLALKEILGCSIVSLLLEPKDLLGKDYLSIGAAALIARKGEEKKWAISSRNSLLPEWKVDAYHAHDYV
jgi:hypothetical protein